MVFFKKTTLEKVNVSTYNSFSRRSAIIKEYKRTGHVNNMRQLPALLNYKVNVGNDLWVTSGFLLARYGPLEVFVRIAPEILSSQLTSDGFNLLFAIASSEHITAFDRLTQFFKQFTMFDVNESDQFGRTPLHYAKFATVYRLLVSRGAVADKPGTMHPFEYMTVTGNRAVFCLGNDFKPMVKALLEHGTTSINFALTVLAHVRGQVADETNRAVLVHFGMLNLFSERSYLFFREANNNGANVPMNDTLAFFDFCCDYLKDKSPGRVQLAIAAVNLEHNIGLLGNVMPAVQASMLKHHAYMRLARIVLLEEPMEFYSTECGIALSRQNVKGHCIRAYRAERLEIAKAMAEAYVPHLPCKLQWCVDWISTAYDLERELGEGEEGQREYHPIIYKLAKMRDEYERSALHVVCENWRDDYRFEFFELLVNLGADINSRDSNGYTPLFHLVDTYEAQRFRFSHGQLKLKMAELLLERGVHIDITDKKRKENVSGKLTEMVKRVFIPSLQCMCAKVLQDNRKNMCKKMKVLPQNIKDFVEMH